MEKFSYKEIDTEGEETLEAISGADRFNRWMYQTIVPFCHGSILEIGSGIGNISAYFVADGHRIGLSDIRQNYCQRLYNQFGNVPQVEGVWQLDLTHPNFDTEYAELLEGFDTVFSLNVIEHIADDLQAIANSKKLLKPGGTLITLAPAHQSLYNRFDKELHHYRRYNKKELAKLFGKQSMSIVHQKYFNLAGIAGWFLFGTVLKNKTIQKGPMDLYNTLVPLFRLLDKISLHRVGLSTFIVGKKPLAGN